MHPVHPVSQPLWHLPELPAKPQWTVQAGRKSPKLQYILQKRKAEVELTNMAEQKIVKLLTFNGQRIAGLCKLLMLNAMVLTPL
jgi:hypothetical protein